MLESATLCKRRSVNLAGQVQGGPADVSFDRLWWTPKGVVAVGGAKIPSGRRFLPLDPLL